MKICIKNGIKTCFHSHFHANIHEFLRGAIKTAHFLQHIRGCDVINATSCDKHNKLIRESVPLLCYVLTTNPVFNVIKTV